MAPIGWVWLAVLLLSRLLPIVLITPLAGGSWLRPGVRLAVVAAVLAVLLTGWLPTSGGALAARLQADVGDERAHQLALIAVEVARGGVLGFAIALVLAGVRSGFSIACALASGTLSSPRPSGQACGLAELSAVLPVALFFAVDGHHAVVQLLADSYRHWPLADLRTLADMRSPALEHAVDRVIVGSARVLTTAVALGAPVLFASVAAGVALGVWQRVHRSLPTLALLRSGTSLAAQLAFATSLVAIAALSARALRRIPELLADLFG